MHLCSDEESAGGKLDSCTQSRLTTAEEQVFDQSQLVCLFIKKKLYFTRNYYIYMPIRKDVMQDRHGGNKETVPILYF